MIQMRAEINHTISQCQWLAKMCADSNVKSMPLLTNGFSLECCFSVVVACCYKIAVQLNGIKTPEFDKLNAITPF